MRKIAFHNVNGNKAFEVEDQGTIRIDQREYVVKYVDEEHFMLGTSKISHDEFMKYYVETGHMVTPGKGLVLREYGTNYKRFDENEKYSYVWLPELKVSGWWSDLRVIRETVPLGYFCADVAIDEGIFYIKQNCWANHVATIIFPKDIFVGEDSREYYDFEFQLRYGKEQLEQERIEVECSDQVSEIHRRWVARNKRKLVSADNRTGCILHAAVAK